MDAIEADRLHKVFGAVTAVNGVTFSVRSGETFAVLGPNGAGKSTLLRVLTTLVPPTSGTARVNGFDVQDTSLSVRRSIGVVSQAMTSDVGLSARENMLFFARLYGVPRRTRVQTVDRLLGAVGLSRWADAPVRQLSGGMRRRVEIARGLVHDPQILFLDEPTTGLDPVSRAAVWDMLDRLKQERRLTILLTTHYMDEADRICDRIAIVDHGTLIALDSPLALKTSLPSRNVVEARFTAPPSDWPQQLLALPGALGLSGSSPVFRIASANGPLTTRALMEQSARSDVAIESLSVQGTTLDDVFVHYTGRDLRDALQSPAGGDRSHLIPQQ